MIFTIPILITNIVDCEIPFTLYKDNNFELLLAEFPIADREVIFGIKNLMVDDGSTRYNLDPNSLATDTIYVSSGYRILITAPDDSEETLRLFNSISNNLNFCCQLYFEYPITLTIFGSDNMSKKQNSIQVFKRRSSKIIIDSKILNSFKNTLTLSIKNETTTAKKRALLNSLLTISNLETFNSGLTCSTYITVLESLFTNENTEITYRFSMRLTKFLNEDLNFLKKIKKLYHKRSSYYHTGEKQFSFEDEVLLSNLTRTMIIEYIQNPGRFDVAKLDNELLT